MKRDMAVIRKLLFAIEENPNNIEVEGVNEDTVKYHLALLIDANLVDGVVAESNAKGEQSEIPLFVTVKTLNWNGHEFIANLREEQVWNTIKREFKDASFATVLSVGKQLAEGYAKKKVEEILKSES
ncbi:MAG: hypothetical protein CL785_04665 [Chloroflexi bacterium]|jgi:hypothetical protein|nr:hypothetical protein [Chloroflexota bacterium]|tara:strand:- start:2270 stop:2650 length:381 start_codon:yes stop_codon:yes gene_type:complete